MAGAREGEVHWLLWPLVALWKLIARLLEISGRLIGVAIGLVLMIAGGVLSLTVVGAPIGIPIGILGLFILLRSIF